MRNGRAKERGLTLGSGTVRIKAPRVNDRRIDEETGERQRFSSQILPRYARRSPKVTEVLPLLCLHGLSTGDFGPALEDLLGKDARGLSPSSIQRLTESWQAEPPSSVVASFASTATPTGSSTASTSRSASARTIGSACSWSSVCEDGVKEPLAVEDGYRESTESWSAVMRDLKERGINEPKLVVGDGALGIGRPSGRVPPRASSGLPGARDRERARRSAQAPSVAGQDDAPRDHGGAHPLRSRSCPPTVREEFDAKYPKAIAKPIRLAAPHRLL